MPFLIFLCTKCDKPAKRYHNVKKCKNCGAAYVRQEGWQSRKSLETENKSLRAEVNRLRSQIGLGLKYVEYVKSKE